jgi:hypothetical protein
VQHDVRQILAELLQHVLLEDGWWSLAQITLA